MKKLFFLFLTFCIANSSIATHILGGQINHTRISGLTYKFKILMYSDDNSNADSPFIDLNVGDGTALIKVNRLQKLSTANSYSVNVYEITHTYGTVGVYNVYFSSENRGALNNATNSISQLFYLHATVNVDISISLVTFETLASPILYAKVGTLFKTNLTNYSNLGTDSLSFQLYPCYSGLGQALTGYQFPAGLSVNSISGELVWANPTQLGKFGVGVMVSLWRNGLKIGTMLRDFTITVYDSPYIVNQPELASNASIDLSNPNGTQVEVGQKVTFRVIVHKTIPSNAKLEFFHPTLTTTMYDSLQYRVAKFDWTPTLAQKQKQPYILTFRAVGIQSFDKTILLYVGYPPQTPSFITALESNEIEDSFVKVFPNPTEDLLNIVSENIVSDSEFQIYNNSGKFISTNSFNNQKHIQLSLNHLPDGTYFYKILQQNKMLHQGKFIKK